MNLDWQDHGILLGGLLLIRAGGHVVSNRGVRKNLLWLQDGMGQLIGHAKWVADSIKTVAHVAHIVITEPPEVKVPTPPPVKTNWAEVLNPNYTPAPKTRSDK